MNKSTQKLMFSSKTDNWATPQDFFDKLDTIYDFTLDPCATHTNHKCDKYFTIEDNGLEQNWAGETVFMNPPYGRAIKHWLEKAYRESLNEDTIVVCLIPSRTDTRYWHDYCMKAEKIYFIKGRLKFGKNTNAAPFPSCVVVFGTPAASNPEMDYILP